MIKRRVDCLDSLMLGILNVPVNGQMVGKITETEIRVRNRIHAYLTEHPGKDFSQIAYDLHINPGEVYLICNKLLKIGRIKIRYNSGSGN